MSTLTARAAVALAKERDEWKARAERAERIVERLLKLCDYSDEQKMPLTTGEIRGEINDVTAGRDKKPICAYTLLGFRCVMTREQHPAKMWLEGGEPVQHDFQDDI